VTNQSDNKTSKYAGKNRLRGMVQESTTSRYGSTTNGKEIPENLLKLDFQVLLKLKIINLETSVYIKLF